MLAHGHAKVAKLTIGTVVVVVKSDIHTVSYDTKRPYYGIVKGGQIVLL